MEITSVCPYCGKEMRDGVIPAYRDHIEWMGRGKDGMLGSDPDDKNSVTLVKAGLFCNYQTPAYYCESCKVSLFPCRRSSGRSISSTKSLRPGRKK